MHVPMFTIFVALVLLRSSTWAQATPQSSSTLASSTGNAVSSNVIMSGNNNGTPATPTSTAQFPSLSGYSACIANCLALGSSSANCTSVVDVNCFCINKRFTQEIVNCVSDGCSTELPIAETLAQQFCNLANHSTSLSFPSTTTRQSSTSTVITTSTDITTISTSPLPDNITTSGGISGGMPPNAASRITLAGFGSMDPFVMGISVFGVILGAYLAM